MDTSQTVDTFTPDNPLLLDHERLTALVNSMADGVLATDEAGTIVLSNGAALNILDVNSSLQGKQLEDIIKLIDANNQPINLPEVIFKHKTQFTNRDWRLVYDDGSSIHLYLSVAPVHLGFKKEGQRGFVLLMRDITHEKSLEEERDEFISVVSHELRTPIAIAEGNVSNAQLIAQRQHVPEGIIKSLKVTYDQIVFLSNMINDLSTLSRAERGKLNVELEAINVNELISSLESDYKSQASAKDLEFKVFADPSLELLHSSRLYVREILQNFITNSIKYTEKGSVSLTAKRRDKGVLFEVSDTGIGISKSDQEKVFDKFFRSEDWRTRQSKGTGLGLYVTMKLARLIHAEIELDSELNQGTTFRIFMPNLE